MSKFAGQRRRFKGVFERFGQKSGYKGLEVTMLLKDVVDVRTNRTVTDHLWFTVGKRFKSLNLKEGDVVHFDARVTAYIKGYRGRRGEDVDNPLERDWRLSFPTKVKKEKDRICLGGEPNRTNHMQN